MIKTTLTFSEAMAVYKSRKYNIEKSLYNTNEEIDAAIGANMALAEQIIEDLARLSPEAIFYLDKEIDRVRTFDIEYNTNEETTSQDDVFVNTVAGVKVKANESNTIIECIMYKGREVKLGDKVKYHTHFGAGEGVVIEEITINVDDYNACGGEDYGHAEPIEETTKTNRERVQSFMGMLDDEGNQMCDVDNAEHYESEYPGQVLCALVRERDTYDNDIVEEEWYRVASEFKPQFGDEVHFNCYDKGMVIDTAFLPIENTQCMYTIGYKDFVDGWGIVAKPNKENEDEIPF